MDTSIKLHLMSSPALGSPPLSASVLRWAPLASPKLSPHPSRFLSLYMSMYLQALMSAPLSQPLGLSFYGSPAWQPRAAEAYPVGGEVRGTQVVPASAAPFGHLQGQSLVPQGQLECRRTMKRGSPPLSHNYFSSLLHLPLPLSCLHSPNTHRLLSWVLSHHTQTHSLPPVSLPPASHRAHPTEPPAALG